MALGIEGLVVPPFGENTFLVWDPATREALLIDPGGEIEAIAQTVAREGLTLKAIVNTHGHIDHVAAAADARRRFGVPFSLHEGDREWVERLAEQAMFFGFPKVQAPQVDHWLVDDEELTLGRLRFRVLHTPGHTAGGCCLFFPDEKVLFTGDTLFVGSIGRTDLPGGSMPQLLDSIRRRLFPLGDDVRFHPGHGPSGALGQERQSNPFVGEHA